LDRCRPDQIAQVLEAINFLTDADGCFVAFGFARPQVLAGIGLANREIAAELVGAEDTATIRKAYAEDYLRKLIQIEVPVPNFNAPQKGLSTPHPTLPPSLARSAHGYLRWGASVCCF
jgi:KAP family P-loop domain